MKIDSLILSLSPFTFTKQQKCIIFQVGLDRPVTQTYRDILTRLPGGNKILESAYETVEFTIASVKNYVDEWLRYQALWDLQVKINE